MMDVGRSAHPGLAGLFCVERLLEKFVENKPVSNVSPWLLLQFLPLGSCTAGVPVFRFHSDVLRRGVYKPKQTDKNNSPNPSCPVSFGQNVPSQQ